MGFYSPSQLIQDARRHHLLILPIAIDHSEWDHTLVHETDNPLLESRPSLRLGFRLIKGFGSAAAERVIAAREQTAWKTGEVSDPFQYFMREATLNQKELAALVSSNAFEAVSSHRYQAHWDALAVEEQRPLLDQADQHQDTPLLDTAQLPPPTETQNLSLDYTSTGLTLKRHPLAILRERAPFNQCKRAQDLFSLNSGRFVRIAGLVTGRQRPGTASGVLFMTLEDETGNTNIVIWKDLQQRFRQAILKGRLLLIKGVMERKHNVIHVIAGEVLDYSEQLPELSTKSRDFH